VKVPNLSLGELVIDIPAAKTGEEAVDVTYTYDTNSILEVEVTVVSKSEKAEKGISGTRYGSVSGRD